MRLLFLVLALVPSLALADDVTPNSFANPIKNDTLKLTVNSALV